MWLGLVNTPSKLHIYRYYSECVYLWLFMPFLMVQRSKCSGWEFVNRTWVMQWMLPLVFSHALHISCGHHKQLPCANRMSRTGLAEDIYGSISVTTGRLALMVLAFAINANSLTHLFTYPRIKLEDMSTYSPITLSWALSRSKENAQVQYLQAGFNSHVRKWMYTYHAVSNYG